MIVITSSSIFTSFSMLAFALWFFPTAAPFFRLVARFILTLFFLFTSAYFCRLTFLFALTFNSISLCFFAVILLSIFLSIPLPIFIIFSNSLLFLVFFILLFILSTFFFLFRVFRSIPASEARPSAKRSMSEAWSTEGHRGRPERRGQAGFAPIRDPGASGRSLSSYVL